MEAVGDLVPPVDVYQQLKYSLLAGHCLTETQRMGRVPNFERNNYFEEDQTRRNGPVQCFVGIPPVSRNKKLTEFRAVQRGRYLPLSGRRAGGKQHVAEVRAVLGRLREAALVLNTARSASFVWRRLTSLAT